MARCLALTRDLVRRLPDSIPDPGPLPHEVRAEGFEERTARALLDRRLPDGTLWLFAFGSLMWKRPFAVAEERPARVRGWHRAFCLGPDTRYRGNPLAPGYMLSLDRGGECQGLALRLPAEGLEQTLLDLLRKEPPFPPSWVTARTGDAAVPAFAFTCPRDFVGYAGRLPEAELARHLARAVGKFGSMPDYLLCTLEHLEALGIRDRMLWRLQALVAAEMERLPPEPGPEPGPRTAAAAAPSPSLASPP